MAGGSVLFGGALAGLSRLLAVPLPQRTRLRVLAAACERLAPVAHLPTPAGELRFVCPTRAAARRPLALFTQEPETKRWLDRHVMPGDTLWDVGANIGQIALYAAAVRGARAVAFEPSARTFGLLNTNIAENRLSERVLSFCVALSARTEVASFYLKDATAGAAMHALGTATNVRGDFTPSFVQSVLALTGDDMIGRFGIAPPDHLKIDVDGAEDAVLLGLKGALPQVKSVLLEWTWPDGAEQGRRLADLLGEGGLVLAPDPADSGVWNRLYLRRPG